MTGAGSLASLAWQTLTTPDAVARGLLGLRLPRGVLLQALALVTILTILLLVILPPPALMIDAPLRLSVFASALFIGATTLILAILTQTIGQALGGQGDLDGALTVIIWTDAVFIAVSLARSLASGLFQGLFDDVLLFGATALKLWVLVRVITVLHGFASAWRGLAVLALATVGVGAGVGLIISLITGVAGHV
jgi:hypothetical protein